MIIQPEKGTRNVNDLFYEAEKTRIAMLNYNFFQNVDLTKSENDVLVWLCGFDEWTISLIASAFQRAGNSLNE